MCGLWGPWSKISGSQSVPEEGSTVHNYKVWSLSMPRIVVVILGRCLLLGCLDPARPLSVSNVRRKESEHSSRDNSERLPCFKWSKVICQLT